MANKSTIPGMTMGRFLLALAVSSVVTSAAQACDGTGRDKCSCVSYSSDYHVMGDEVIADYEMSVDAQDLRNSHNQPLSNLRAILQQDRANYHKFDKASASDTADSYFTTAAHRKMFQSLPLTSFCESDASDPSILYDPIEAVIKNAMHQGVLLHVMLYRIDQELRLHIAPFG